MVLSYRSDELATLRDAFARCDRGQGRTILVSGGLATGKTALLHALREHATAAGALVLDAIGARAERGIEHGVVNQLLTRAESPDRLCAVLLDAARERPVVVVVDDVHFADDASLRALLYLHRRIGSARLLLLLAERGGPPSGLPPRLHGELGRLAHFREIRLAPLSGPGVVDLLRERLDASTARRLAPACAGISGGNVLLLHALADDNRAAGGGAAGDRPAGPVVGPAFGRAVVACLHRAEPDLPRVAQAVAILGGAATDALVGRMTTMDGRSVARALDALTAAGLLDGPRFRHPGAREAVLDSLSPADRADLHARAAEVLHREGYGAVDVAGHLTGAGRADGGWAVRVLREAAEQALAEDRVPAAVHRLELALRGCAGERERAEVTRTYARARCRDNPAAAVLDPPPPDGRAAVVRCLLWQGRRQDAATALRAAPRTADSRVMAELRLAYQWVYGPAYGPAVLAEAVGQRAVQQPVAAPDDPWTQAAVAFADAAGGRAEAATVATAERLLRGCRLGDATLEVLTSALLSLGYAGRPDLAEAPGKALLDEADTRGAPTWRAVLGCVRAEIALRQGNPAAATRYAREALDRLRPRSWGVLIGFPLSVLMAAATAAGKPGDAAAVLRRQVPDATFDTLFGLRYLHARGAHNLATGRALAAAADFKACGGLMTGRRLDLPALLPWRAGLAEAQQRLGDPPTGATHRGVGGPIRLADRRAAQPVPPAHLAPPHRRAQPTQPAHVLSEAERRVATLAAYGRTNREVAAELYITVSTVEQHLTRVYRKLGVRRRTDLRSALDRPAAVSRQHLRLVT